MQSFGTLFFNSQKILRRNFSKRCRYSGGTFTANARERALLRSRRSEPRGEGISEPALSRVADPRPMPVRPDQQGVGRGDRTNDRKLPSTRTCRVDLPD